MAVRGWSVWCCDSGKRYLIAYQLVLNYAVLCVCVPVSGLRVHAHVHPCMWEIGTINRACVIRGSHTHNAEVG